MQTGDEPERARQKYSFSARQSIYVFLLRSITQYQTVLHQLPFNRLDRPAHSFVGERQESGKRHHQQTGVERIRSVILDKRLLLLTVSVRANLSMDLIANFSPTTNISVGRTPAFLYQFNSTIEGHPGHHFGMGEMFGTAAHLPDSLVRFIPI